MTITHDNSTNTLTRRRLALGAAWAVPAIAVGSAAPAMAASPCSQPCLTTGDTNFGTSRTATNGWSLAANLSHFYGSGTDQAIGWYSGFTFPGSQTANVRGSSTQKCFSPSFVSSAFAPTLSGPVVVAQGDPRQAGATISWSKSFCLVANRTYTFTYAWMRYGPNPLAAHMYTYMTPGSAPAGAGGTLLGSVNTAPAFSNNASGSTSVSYTPTAGGFYTFYFHWTFDTASSYPAGLDSDCPTYANDFAVNAPLVTCSSTN